MEVNVPLAGWMYVQLLLLGNIKLCLRIKSSNCSPLLVTSSHPIKYDDHWNLPSQ